MLEKALSIKVVVCCDDKRHVVTIPITLADGEVRKPTQEYFEKVKEAFKDETQFVVGIYELLLSDIKSPKLYHRFAVQQIPLNFIAIYESYDKRQTYFDNTLDEVFDRIIACTDKVVYNSKLVSVFHDIVFEDEDDDDEDDDK